MPKIRLKYDGWLVLPAAVREKLDLASGDELEVEVIDGAIVLRPARRGVAARAEEAPAPAPRIEAPTPELVAAAPVKRGPGRPRKTPPAALPPALRVRGRRAVVPAAE